MDGRDIRFPTDHYVGFQARTNDPVPLGFMTPDGSDEAALKRKRTVDRWATHKIKPISYPNKPMAGFSIRKTVQHSNRWGSGATKWRVLDPRGFELEINSNNMLQIMETCIIREGRILDTCMWARLKNENILVPVKSEVYQRTLENTARQNKVADIKDARPGDHVILQNGIEGTFLGSFVHFEIERWSARKLKRKSKRIFIEQMVDGKPRLYDTASVKLSEIIPCETPLSDADTERLVNRNSGSGSECYVYKLASKRMDRVPITTITTAYNERLTVVDKDGQEYIITRDPYSNGYRYGGSSSYRYFLAPTFEPITPDGVWLKWGADGTEYSRDMDRFQASPIGPESVREYCSYIDITIESAAGNSFKLAL